MGKVEDDGTIILDTPGEIQMFALLQARHRLKLEMKGLKFRDSTIAAINRQFGTGLRTRKQALAFINKTIKDLGGPADRNS